MTKTKTSSVRPPFATIPAVIVLAVVVIFLTGGGFAFAATQEEHDTFCASCHTQPESTFFQRESGAQPVDLASSHKQSKDVRCIDCHSGNGVTGRVQAELLGARNAAAFYTGTAVQPAHMTVAIGDANCLKCHQDVAAKQGFDNHFHAFLARWQAADPQAAKCTTCHGGHNTSGTAQNLFIDIPTAQAACDACHRALGRD